MIYYFVDARVIYPLDSQKFPLIFWAAKKEVKNGEILMFEDEQEAYSCLWLN